MAETVFIDTSVLLNLLDVPRKNSDRDEAVTEFKRLAKDVTVVLIIPVTAVIETGNHIAQLADGGLRRDRAARLCQWLRHALDGTSPWGLSRAEWDDAALGRLIEGHAHLPTLPELASQGVGAGDAAILHERQRFLERVEVPSGQLVRIWTYDHGLGSYA
jgi:hypothetical protein